MHNFCTFRTFPNRKRLLASSHCVFSYFWVHHWQHKHEQENTNGNKEEKTSPETIVSQGWGTQTRLLGQWIDFGNRSCGMWQFSSLVPH